MEERISKLEPDTKDLARRLETYRDSLRDQLKSVEKSLQKLTEDSRKIFGFVTRSISITSRATFLISVAMSTPKRIHLSTLKGYGEDIKELIDYTLGTSIEAMGMVKSLTGFVLLVARLTGQSFNQIALLMVDELGRDLAKEIVLPEDILRSYGPDAVSTWKSLVGSGAGNPSTLLI